MTITLKVGDSGPEVVKLQTALKAALKASGDTTLLPRPDGKFGEKTKSALLRFQVLKKLPQTGLYDVATAKVLPLVGGVEHPSVGDLKNPLRERVAHFLQVAKDHWGVVIPVTCTFRTGDHAQKLHIAHMVRYNSYKYQRPSGVRSHPQLPHVIAWSYLEQFKVARMGWRGVKWEDFLRTKAGNVPRPNAARSEWETGQEPEENKTREQALKILREAGVHAAKLGVNAHKPHSAMVAPGYHLCGEPCRCGGHASKHTSYEAVDLGLSEVKKLEAKLREEKLDLDAYIKDGFKLHRPLWTPARREEDWHFEALA